MVPVWIAARSRLRRRWGSTVLLTLLVGLAGGVVMAAVAGASRTDTAMERFVAFSRPEDLVAIVNGARGDPSDPAVVAEGLAVRSRVLALPQLAEVGRAPYLLLSADQHGKDLGAINPFAAADDRIFRTLDRPRLLRGRTAAPDRPDEAVVDDLTASQRHLYLGSQVQMWSFTAAQLNSTASAGSGKFPAPEGPSYTFRIVGIVRPATTVNAPPVAVARDALYQGQGGMYLTPAFLYQYASDQGVPEEALPGMENFRVRLRNGLADLPAFEAGVRQAVSPGDGQVHAGSDVRDAADKAQRAIHLEAIALVIFAGVAGLAALVVLGQALARQVTVDATDNLTLGALGLSHRQLVLVPLVRAGLTGLGGGSVAAAVAVALSPLTPIGMARRAEVHPGVAVNVAVLVLGFVGVAALTVLRALPSAWRAAFTVSEHARGQAAARPGALHTAVAGAGLGPAAVVGGGMSFERGRGVAVRMTLVGVVAAVSGVVAAVTFGVSLQQLVDTPRQQGWNWDVVVGNPRTSQALAGDPAAEALHSEMTRLLAGNRYVDAFSGLALTDGITVDGHLVKIAGVETVRGSVFPVIVAGRAPVSGDEIALGGDVLARVHKRIGQIVTVSAGGERAAATPTTMRIVGESLQPTAGNLSSRLGDGGVATVSGVQRLVPDTPVLLFAVRYASGADGRAALRSLVDDFGRYVLRPYPGGEIGEVARVDLLPYVLAGFLVILAVGTLGLTLAGSVRRHRRDLAVLKTIGFLRPQVSAVVAWQATTLAVASVALGVPSGIVLGRWAWRLLAGGLGSVSPPITPLAAVLLVVPATVLVANLVVGPAAWVAGRVRPAEALRTE